MGLYVVLLLVLRNLQYTIKQLERYLVEKVGVSKITIRKLRRLTWGIAPVKARIGGHGDLGVSLRGLSP